MAKVRNCVDGAMVLYLREEGPSVLLATDYATDRYFVGLYEGRPEDGEPLCWSEGLTMAEAERWAETELRRW